MWYQDKLLYPIISHVLTRPATKSIETNLYQGPWPYCIVTTTTTTHLITHAAQQAGNSENPSSCSSFDIWDLTRATLGDNKWCLESFNKTILTVCPHNTVGGISVWKIALIIISVISRQFLLLFSLANRIKPLLLTIARCDPAMLIYFLCLR